MKKLLLLVFIASVIGCESHKKTKLIEFFVSTKDGVTSNLSFKMINLKEIIPITVTDSMLFFLADTIPTKYIWKGDSLYYTYPDRDGSLINDVMSKSIIDSQILSWSEMRKRHEKDLSEAKSNLKGVERDIERDTYNRTYAFTSFMKNLYESSIESAEESISIIDGVLEDLKSAKKYSLIPSDTRLLRAFECTYSIINPVLRIKQTQTQIFYFDNDLTKVIDSYLKK
jgi:hypothetical protein